MGQKISYQADQPKKGMTLAELNKAVQNASGLAHVNQKPEEDCKVTLLINFSGGIKELTVEV